MGKRGKGRGTDSKGRSKVPGTFVRLEHRLLDGAAWRHLSPSAAKLLIAIWRRHTGTNNGVIPFATREAQELLGCGPNKAVRLFRELADKGFLICARESSFTLKTREAREWELTGEPTRSAPASRDFERWQPEIQNTVTVSEGHGYQSDNRSAAPDRKRTVDGSRSDNRTPPFPPPNGYPGDSTSNLPSQGGSQGAAKRPGKLSPKHGRRQSKARHRAPVQASMPTWAALQGLATIVFLLPGATLDTITTIFSPANAGYHRGPRLAPAQHPH